MSATEILTQLAQELRREDVELLIAHGIAQTRDVLRRAGGEDAVLQTIYATVDDAVASIEPRTGDGATP